MAYAALRSLAQILQQTLNRDYQYLILDEKQQIKSLVEKITYLQKDLSSQKITQDEEIDIRDAAYVAEDIIESRIIERFRRESAGHEDGSTEKELIRFDVIESWIVSSSISASSRSGLEIVGVCGIEKPRTFQTIYGIRQLARTLQFKAWFLGSGVLPLEEETGLLTGELPRLDAIWALERLATHDTKMVIIGDSSSPASMMKLSIAGYDTSRFVGVITSEDLRADDAWVEELWPSYNDTTSWAELINRKIKKFTLNFKWACWKKPSPASPSTWHDREAKMYKSAMEMAGVDATDHCIAVGCNHRDIKAANAAGISSIFIAGYSDPILCGRREFTGINRLRYLALRHADAHPTYVLPSFIW